MPTTYQQLLDRLRPTLNDAAKNRYPDARLLEWCKDALRELVIYRPDIFAIVVTYNCVAGVEQDVAASAGAQFLVDVLQNASGEEVTEIDYESFRLFNPTFRTEPAGDAEHWMSFPRPANQRPNTQFLVYPPSLDGQPLQVVVVAYTFENDAVGSDIPIPASYEPALEAYIIFRAESGDDEHTVEQRAALFRQAFETILGIGAKTERPEAD